jgi:hypothetical protein
MGSRWHRVTRTLVGLYPGWWRERYGAELLEVLDQHDITLRTVGNLLAHVLLARLAPRASHGKGFTMPRLRPRLVALVAAFPLFLIAFASWFSADEPVDSHAISASIAGHLPLWRIAESVMSVCLQIMAAALILGATAVAAVRVRSPHRRRAIGYGAAALFAFGGPAVFLAGLATHPNTPPAHPELYLLALVLGLLVGIAVLAVAALRARTDRPTARVVAVPATLLSLVLLVTFTALVGYTADLSVHGVPLITVGTPGIEHTASVHIYPVDALPAEYRGLLPSLIVSLVASLAALTGAAYAALGAIRGIRTTPSPA